MNSTHLLLTSFFAGILLATGGACSSTVRAQSPGPSQADSSSNGANEDARRKVLESDEWRRMRRHLNEWLSVQTVYTPEQLDEVRAELRQRIESMSPHELENFQKDMESRLDVLLSPEAEDARKWLSQFLAVAVNPEQQLGRQRPDVLNMTASQIRQEIRWLQQTRDARQQSQAAFQRTRATQSQAARDAAAQQQQVRQQPRDRSAWPANNPRRPSQYAPQAELAPAPLPDYLVSPWGHPIFWGP